MSNRIETLDGQGFVELVDSMGDDRRITESARVSYAGDGEIRPDWTEQKLIRYLLRNHHTSPFEHVVFTLHAKVPIFVARQWMRHRTWSYNEVSARYTELDEGYYTPKEWRGQSSDNKQMSDGSVPMWVQATSDQGYHITAEQAFAHYREMIDNGVSREMARFILPLSTFTRFYGTVNLKNLLDYFRLRDHEHAQQEIREYAVAMRDLVRPVVPMTMEVFDGNS